MAFVDQTHQHYASQIIKDNLHEPIDPNGGGVTVTDGTTSVAASSIQMPTGTVANLGSGVAGVSYVHIATAQVSYDTPGVVDPTWYGPAVLDIPAGAYFRAYALAGEAWNGDGAGDYLGLTAATDDLGSGAIFITQYEKPIPLNSSPSFLYEFAPSYLESVDAFMVGANIPKFTCALADGVLCVGYWMFGSAPTAGSATIVLEMVVPAS